MPNGCSGRAKGDGNRLCARQRRQAIAHLARERAHITIHRVLRWRQRHLERDELLRFESKVDVDELHEAANEQTGADHNTTASAISLTTSAARVRCVPRFALDPRTLSLSIWPRFSLASGTPARVQTAVP
jgi:hypothetical protein